MSVEKALTFRASSIGDCLMGKYLLENIHAKYPQARLGIVVSSRIDMIRDLCAAYPWLEVIEANRRNPKSLFLLWKNFRGSDLVVTQYAGKKGGKFSGASKLVARVLAKRPTSLKLQRGTGGLVGFHDASVWNTFLYDKLVPVRSDIAVAEHDRAALRAAGISLSLPFPTLQCIENSNVLQKFNLEDTAFIVVHLFAGNAGRGLHTDKKRAILTALAERFPDLRLVISGGAADREEAVRITEHPRAKVVAGDATLQDMMNLIKHSRCVVSVDTGMAHIAAQLGKPLVVMTTCLGRNWWFPEQYGEGASITVLSCDNLCAAGHSYKDFPVCINEIDVEDVASRAAVALR